MKEVISFSFVEVVSRLHVQIESSHHLLAITRELLKQILIRLSKLRAAELANQIADEVSDRVQQTQEQIRLRLRRQLEGKAAEVVALQEVAGVEDAAGEVVDVDAGEAVGGAEVTVTGFC